MRKINEYVKYVETKKVSGQNDMQRLMGDALINNAKVINGIKYIEIPTQLLRIEEYQRGVGSHHKDIAARWDKKRAGAIIVSYRNGGFYIIDGQHRYLAAMLVGEKVMTCQVYESLTKEQESIMFAEQLQNVRKLTTLERLKALVVAKDEKALALMEICKRYNIIVFPKDKSQKPILKGVSAAIRSYEMYGRECLEFTFGIIKEAGWRNVVGAYSEAMILTLRSIYTNHQHELDEVKRSIVNFIEKMTFAILTERACGTYVGRGKHVALSTFLEKYLESDLNQYLEK